MGPSIVTHTATALPSVPAPSCWCTGTSAPAVAVSLTVGPHSSRTIDGPGLTGSVDTSSAPMVASPVAYTSATDIPGGIADVTKSLPG